MTLLVQILLIFLVVAGFVYHDQKKARKTVELNEQCFRILAAHTGKAVFEWDYNRKRMDFPNVEQDFGQKPLKDSLSSADEGIYAGVVHPDDCDIYREKFSDIINGRAVENLRVRMRAADEAFKYYSISSVVVCDAKGKPYKSIGFIEDIDSQIRKENYLRQKADTDQLTGFNNKAAAETLISEVLASSSVEAIHALLCVDLDNFKGINDGLGHLYGDEVLKEIAANIKALFRASDILGRFGGDEFVVFVRDIPNIEFVREKAAELNRRIHKTYRQDNTECTVSASIGIALFPVDGSTYETIYKRRTRLPIWLKTQEKIHIALLRQKNNKMFKETAEMKKMIPLVIATIMILTLAACGSSNPPQNSGSPASAPTTTPDSTPTSGTEPPAGSASPSVGGEISNTNILIAYFSVPEDVSTDGVDAVSGASVVVKDGEKLGDTQYLAQIIQKNSGGDLFRIETVQQYPLDHAPLLDFAKKEQNEDARPELSTHVENMDGYDVIFLGYPNWWADLPQPLYTFLEEYDLSGKTIIPFCPHGGSGFSRTINTIADLQPNATVEENSFSVSRNSVPNAESDVIAWVNELGYYNTASNNSSSPVQVTLTVGNSAVTAELDDSEIARQFAALLPQTISMTRGRDREYYGRIDGTLSYDEGDIQTTAEDGDLAYWFSGNSLAFFFNTENDSAVNSGIVVFGKITSDLSVFDNMGSSETVTVTPLE